MKKVKSIKVLLCALVSATVCTGCLGGGAEPLYALPRQSQEYYELQSAIDRVMGDAVYAGPLTGSNQQAVQLADLDADGTDEALAFVKTTGENPLKIYIFDEMGSGTYENTALIEGDGSAFDAVDYVRLDDRPGLEILVGRRLSDQILQSLSAYSYENGNLTELMNANYTEYAVADLSGKDCRDVFVLRMDMETGGVAELYRYEQGRMMREPEVTLSMGARQVKRIVTGHASADEPAVFVASTFEENSIVTDIFAFRDGRFTNVAANAQTGLVAPTVRNYGVYALDIDADGLIELPAPVALPSANAQEETRWVIEWYNLLPDGKKQIKQTTYHDYRSGWYLELPAHWQNRLTVSRSEETSNVCGEVFSRWNGRDAEPEPIFTIYALTGADRLKRAQIDGRFFLAEKGETAYAASLGTCNWAETLTEKEIRDMFHFIQMDWNSGER